MRKVFLDTLVRYKDGANKGKVNWEKSIGAILSFVYDDVSGVIKIDSVIDSRHVEIEYNGQKFRIPNQSILHAYLGTLVGKTSNTRKYCVGDVINDKEILSCKSCKESKNGHSIYQYKCLKDGHIGFQTAYGLRNHKCPVCSNLVVVENVNSIKVTDPYIYNIILDEDRNTYRRRINKKVKWRCPICNGINYTYLSDIVNRQHNLPCVMCGDGVSYPEKILFNVLNFVSHTFETHKHFKWSEGREYDVYDNGIFIEIHGPQHYERGFKNVGGRSLEEEVENDKLKRELAYAYDSQIKDYIVIDARKSDFEYIKNNILRSKLSIYYNLKSIDWEYIKSISLKSLVKETADLFNSNVNIEDIAAILHIHISTVYRYLRKATTIHLCNYIPQTIVGNKKIICLNNHQVFNSISDARRWCGLKSNGSITRCLQNPKDYTAGRHPKNNEKLKWMYLDEYSLLGL